MTQTELHSVILQSSFGGLIVTERDGVIIALGWNGFTSYTETPPPHPPVLHRARIQLGEYFAGTRREFDLPLAPEGTDFQKKVWDRLTDIPFGGIESYGTIADDIGSGARAVGTACGQNPIPILIPCHRVVQADGNIGSYSAPGGAVAKGRLLSLEHYALTDEERAGKEEPGQTAKK